MRCLLALSTLCLLAATPARAQNCYGQAFAPQSYAAPQQSVPVEETTVTTTRSYSVPVAPQQAFAPQCQQGQCRPAQAAAFDPGYGFADPQPVYRQQAFAPSCPQQAPVGVGSAVAGNFGGGLTVNSRRRVILKNNQGLGNLGGGGPININSRRRVIIKNNTF